MPLQLKIFMGTVYVATLEKDGMISVFRVKGFIDAKNLENE